MKKLISIILALATLTSLLSLVSCENSEIELNKSNFDKYIAFNITFGDIQIIDNNENDNDTKHYHLLCNAQVTTFAKGDYIFSDVTVTYIYSTGTTLWEIGPSCTTTIAPDGSSSSSFTLSAYTTLPLDISLSDQNIPHTITTDIKEQTHNKSYDKSNFSIVHVEGKVKAK